MKTKTEYQKWTENLQGCHRQRLHKQFAIGDALVKAFSHWQGWQQRSDIYDEAEKFTGHERNSLKQFKRVAIAFPPTCRNLHEVTWGHHQILTAVKNDARRFELLDIVDNQHLDSDAVRELVAKELEKTVLKRISFKVPLAEYNDLKSQAKAEEVVPFSGIIRISQRRGFLYAVKS